MLLFPVPVPTVSAQGLRPFAHIASKEIDESSGLARSVRRKGIYWTHNDSGDTARLFGIRLDGTVVEEHAIANATNVDWEDVAVDGDTIWIDDCGNNGNARRDLALYRVREGEWRATRYPVAYPEQKEFPPRTDRRFDCEAIFIRRGKPYLITKWRLGPLPGFGAALYRMDTRSTDRPNVVTRLGERTDLEGWVTAADLSPNGKELAVLCHLPVPSIWIFDARGDDRILSRPIARLKLAAGGRSETAQIESIAWENDRSLIFGNEGGDLFRVARAALAKR
ncbi:hypothetical protein EON77_03990 [bacterium]|nr:MAG: hypothetical protein EON77_03990 [bacterium]